MENFGNWLIARLKEKNISQSELARMAGVSKGTISNLVNGTKGAGQDSLTAIAHALRLPPELVFEKAGILPAKPELSPLKRALIHAIETDDELPEADLLMLQSIIDQRKTFYQKNPQARPSK